MLVKKEISRKVYVDQNNHKEIQLYLLTNLKLSTYLLKQTQDNFFFKLIYRGECFTDSTSGHIPDRFPI